MNKEIRNDDNIGVISISRTNGGSVNRFVGSTVPSETAISIKVYQAEKTSSKFDKERFIPTKGIVTVELTPSQWAELITSLNIGVGSPCTITRLNGKRIEQTYETESVCSYYENRLQDEFSNITNRFDALFEDAMDILSNKKSINKADRETIMSAYREVERFMGDSAPFIQKMFKEDLDKHTVDAAMAFKNDMSEAMQLMSINQLERISNTKDIASEEVITRLKERNH